MATAAFERLRRGYPDAEITAGMRPYLRSLIGDGGWFDDVIETPRASSAAALWRAARALRERRFDLAVVLPNSLETGLAVRMAGIPVRVGYRQGRPLLMNRGLRAQPGRRWWQRSGARRVPTPMPEYYDALLDVLELPTAPLRLSLSVDDGLRTAAAEWFAARGVGPRDSVVALNAGASFGASKLWEPDRFAAVARALGERGHRALFLCGPAEVEMVRGMATDSGALAACDPVLPLDMLKALVARARLVITTDSGPRHVALALGVPVVCLIGPNDPRYTNYMLDAQTVIRRDLECSPCQRKVCPLGHRACMTGIEVDEVLAAADPWLAGG